MRIGFCCKWIDRVDQVGGIKPKDVETREYNIRSTTVRWLNEQPREFAEQRLWELMIHNITSTRKLVERVGNLDPHLRMVRLSSPILPCATEQSWKYFWKLPGVRSTVEREFAKVGKIARELDVRLSFHPGQFVVLASDNPDVVERSIEEFEYHVDMAKWMGFGRKFQDFKINIHISGRKGPQGIRDALKRLSPEAKNTITIENDEISWGFDSSLELADDLALVLDIHHHFVKTGEYIDPKSDAVKRMHDSWRGVRPVIHYSVSPESVLSDHAQDVVPCLNTLLEAGHNKQKLRKHSDFFWNQAVNDWALQFWDDHDIQCESKAKNLASFALFDYAKKIKKI